MFPCLDLTLYNRLQQFAWRRRCSTLARACLHGYRCIFVVSVYSNFETGIMGTSACRCAYSTGVFNITVHICNTITAWCARLFAVCSFTLEDKGGPGSLTSLCRALVAWCGELILTEEKLKVLCCVFVLLTG